MTTFWKPRLLGSGPESAGIPTKMLGRMVYEWWCRCDLCYRSGPSTHFARWYSGVQESQLCDECDIRLMAQNGSSFDGWTRYG